MAGNMKQLLTDVDTLTHLMNCTCSNSTL